MLEITGNHIAKLCDEDLRTLVVRLCEAELRRANLPIASITAGGNQNAPDGGLDVYVALPKGAPDLDFIPKPVTGFQVKQTDMPPSTIFPEMCPNGILRASIGDLATAEGAYVIVSGQGSTADRALKSRKKAMRESIGTTAGSDVIHLDFYDRDRLARWVRGYPGVEMWVRERIGESLSGWHPYGKWAFGDRDDSEYLLDERGRIVAKQSGSHDQLTVVQGIQAMRRILAQSGGIVRLIGLSGMGKTRLAQALFDNRVGIDELDRSIVVYTDQSFEPSPSARDMIHRLAASSLRAIVIVDNCNPETHRVLAQALATPGSALSLITIEYDVADDEPEETQVFQLEPASENVIAEILQHLVPQVSQPDRQRIAEFSGGNARIALALARTVKSRESLARLDDAELFKRLFYQRQGCGELLMRAAEACSLVYSFDGETLEGDSAELPILAELAGLSSKELFRQVGVLRERDLVQRRSRWRAVLPHAVANKLARQALDQIPLNVLNNAFAQKGKDRLLKSFSRRLGYLHDCEPARKISEYWFSSPDWLHNPARLNELGVAMFQNLAPLAPEMVLQAIEDVVLGEKGDEFLSTDSVNRSVWARILRAIAYDPPYFDRATWLLARFAAAEPLHYNYNPVRGVFKELFHLYLSGTHAPVEQRLAVVRRLLECEDATLHKCAMVALDALLEAWHFGSFHDFSFGARPRDFGWEPKTEDEITAWYRAVVDFAGNLALSPSLCRLEVKTMLAANFRPLWMKAGICADLENLAHNLNAQDGWEAGWIAVRKTISFDIDRMAPEMAERLRRLETELRPQGLMAKVRAYVLSAPHGHLDVADGEAGVDGESTHVEAWERIERIAEDLGKSVIAAPGLLAELLPELLQGGGGRHWPFGRGIALEGENLDAIWQQLRNTLSDLPENTRNVLLLRGFIEGTNSRSPETVNRFLNEAVSDPVLGPIFPLLQASVEIDELGAERLISSITADLAKAHAYRYLAYGGVSKQIPLPHFKRLVLGIATKLDGYPVAVDIFSMRLFYLNSEKCIIGQETAALGRELLTFCDFQERDQNEAYHINEIAAACLQGETAYDDALTICANFARALFNYRSRAWEFGQLANTLFKLQPRAALKTFLGGGNKRLRSPLTNLFSLDWGSPVNAAPPEMLLAWAKKNPVVRFPRLADEVHLFDKNGEHDIIAWSPLALRILELAPDRAAILGKYSSRFRPRCWSGSLADALFPYRNLAAALLGYDDTLVVSWAKKQSDCLDRQIEEERKRDQRVDESFE